MKPSAMGALLGAMVGFVAILALYLFVIQSNLVQAVLFPGHAFIRYANVRGMGDFGLMVFDFFAYFSNIALYAAIGFALGRLFDRNRTSPVAQGETSHD